MVVKVVPGDTVEAGQVHDCYQLTGDDSDYVAGGGGHLCHENGDGCTESCRWSRESNPCGRGG